MAECQRQAAYSQNRRRVWCQLVLAMSWFVSSFVATELIAGEAASSPHKGVRDFAAYWASAQLLLSAQNPYSPPDLFNIQKNLGLQEDSPLVMWNPPWTFAVTLPFGLLDFATGQFLWLLLQVFLLLASAQLLWNIYGEPAGRYRLAWLLTVTFVPSVFVLVIGQIAPLVLAGFAGFLYFERRGMKFTAGALLALTLVKPHFVYLFWIVFVPWFWQRRQWSLLLGTAVVGTAAAILPLFFNPSVYHQYVDLFRPTDLRLPLELPAPTLRNAANLLLQLDLGVWQMLPSLLAAMWILFYWWRHRADWQWSERLPLILIVSLTTSAYTWTFDQVVLMPAIIQGASWLVRRRLLWYRSIAALLYITIDLVHLVLRFFVAEELWYFWLAPALLIAYLVYRWEMDGDTPTSS
jgi:hypothetical protein